MYIKFAIKYKLIQKLQYLKQKHAKNLQGDQIKWVSTTQRKNVSILASNTLTFIDTRSQSKSKEHLFH